VATLTLKKPKLIGDIPLENIASKFVVMRQSKSTKSFKFTCYHNCFEDAMREATRLAGMHVDQRFLVLQVCGSKEWGET